MSKVELYLELVGSNRVLLERDLAAVERRLVDWPVGVGDEVACLVVVERAPIVEERDEVERETIRLVLGEGGHGGTMDQLGEPTISARLRGRAKEATFSNPLRTKRISRSSSGKLTILE